MMRISAIVIGFSWSVWNGEKEFFLVDEYLKKNLKLIPLKECINNNLYEMYQDIPKNEVGS